MALGAFLGMSLHLGLARDLFLRFTSARRVRERGRERVRDGEWRLATMTEVEEVRDSQQ